MEKTLISPLRMSCAAAVPETMVFVHHRRGCVNHQMVISYVSDLVSGGEEGGSPKVKEEEK